MSKVTLDTSGLDHFQRLLRPEAERAVGETTAAVWSGMRQSVAVDEGELQESIQEFGSGLQQGVETTAPHAWAQEAGRPDLTNYTYTPYAKPTVEAEREKHTERCKAAVKRAIR